MDSTSVKLPVLRCFRKSSKDIYAPQDATVEILSVQLDTRSHDSMSVFVRFTDVLPAGFKRGMYLLRLEGGKYFVDLPEDLFEDGEVPKDELDKWQEHTDI